MQQQGDYVLLRADNLRLILPQEEVGAAEYIPKGLRPPDDLGLMGHESEEYATAFYIALDADFRPITQDIPRDRYLATLLGKRENLYWCWSDVDVLIDFSFNPLPMPEVLQARHPLLKGYIIFEEQPVFICDAEAVINFALGNKVRL